MTTRYKKTRELIEARASDPVAARRIEKEITARLLEKHLLKADDTVRPMTFVQHGLLSPFAATEEFGRALAHHMKTLAKDIGLRALPADRFIPSVASRFYLNELWKARQVVDACGVPYAFYAEYATQRWYEEGNERLPRPTQLTSPDYAIHVLEQWQVPANRLKYPILEGWDEYFKAANYRGEPLQNQALQVIDQRVLDAEAGGLPRALPLVNFLDIWISPEMCDLRYGAHFTAEVMKLEALIADPDTDIADLLG